MRASKLALAAAVAFLSTSYFSSNASAQQSDQEIAERVLGSQWKQLSRRAGMIFSGTVLHAGLRASPTDRITQGTTPAVELSFQVDEAIAGVERGQIFQVREWVGAWTIHRPMYSGQHILIFLYPLSRLGLTSPVGGPLGQIQLDESGKIVSPYHENVSASSPPNGSPPRPLTSVNSSNISVVQLERAIRNAREASER